MLFDFDQVQHKQTRERIRNVISLLKTHNYLDCDL